VSSNETNSIGSSTPPHGGHALARVFREVRAADDPEAAEGARVERERVPGEEESEGLDLVPEQRLRVVVRNARDRVPRGREEVRARPRARGEEKLPVELGPRAPSRDGIEAPGLQEDACVRDVLARPGY
jgi:hypothetical protein